MTAGNYRRLALASPVGLLFLFVCPDCKLPIATSRIADQKNLEPLDAEIFEIKCGYCDETSDVLGVTATIHWVTPWPSGTH
jgi:hypothetical protein